MDKILLLKVSYSAGFSIKLSSISKTNSIKESRFTAFFSPNIT
ncbi:hypothetical protein PROVRETT_08888 [Providencia rettgeri DSM 1131]|nr:hypothetical protein PROVRETT_08888 [Providencia rettgeri DSM 1131]